MAKTIFHIANSRGNVDLGWLKSNHTFSFGNYYNPERINFGALRVLNDDTVAGGKGFGTHPHDNMEIISIPLGGGLKHHDSMDNIAVIQDGDIQVMSAGTGIFHEEHNNDQEEDVHFLQIWIYPNQLNVTPRYAQLTLDKSARHNKLQQILSPDANDQGVWIYQNAWFQLGDFDKGSQVSYTLHDKNNGVYVFIIYGFAEVEGQQLHTSDGLGITELDDLKIRFIQRTEFLIMEVPMNF